jgi:multidrug transporter EmrE-like cation transporter
MKLSKKHIVYIVVILFVYFVVNIFSIKVQYVPGMITFIFFGGVGPLLAIIVTWIFLKKRFINKSLWITVSGILSVFFIISGFVSLYYIGSLWASI